MKSIPKFEPKPNPVIQVSVIVPVLNDNRRLEQLLKSLSSQTLPKDLFEVIVIDNGSRLSPQSLVESFGYKFLFDPRSTGEGPRNTGILASKAPTLAFTDSDCIVACDWLESGLEELKLLGRDMVAGKISFSLSSPPDSSEICDAITYLQIEDAVRDRHVAFFANLFADRNVFLKTGMISESLFGNGDIDFTLRAHQLGFKLAYSETPKVVHPARKFISLIKKSHRVGYGKGLNFQREKKVLIKKSQNLPHIQNLNPLNTFSKTKSKLPQIKINFITMVSVWFHSMLVIISIGTGLIHGILTNGLGNREESTV